MNKELNLVQKIKKKKKTFFTFSLIQMKRETFKVKG